MYSAIVQCNGESLGELRSRSDTYSSVDSLLSSDDSNQTSDRKTFSSEETDPGYADMDRTETTEVKQESSETSFDEVFLDEEKKCKIIQLAEFYLSDEQVLKDVFLLKHVKRNKEGYISLKLLSSFKKMKSATKDWREVALALRDSEKLQVNESSSKVRRRDPLPDYDETCSSRVVLAFNLPFEKPTVANLMEKFSKFGDIVSVRIANPGTISADIKKYKIKHKALGSTVCAIVEYDSYKSAAKCAEVINSSTDNNWREMQVVHIASTKATEDMEKPESTAPKRKRLRPKNKSTSRLSESSGGYSTSPSLSSSDVDQPTPPNRSSMQKKDRFEPNDGSRRSMSSKHVKSNSYSETRNVSFNEYSLISGLNKRLNSKLPFNGRRHSDGNVLGDNISKERKRACSFSIPVKSAIQVIRNPIGPDGTNGFRLRRPNWTQCPLIPAC